MTTKGPLEQAAGEVRDTVAFLKGLIRGPIRELRTGFRELAAEVTGEPEPSRLGEMTCSSCKGTGKIPGQPAFSCFRCGGRGVESCRIVPEVVCGTCGNTKRVGRPGHEVACPSCTGR